MARHIWIAIQPPFRLRSNHFAQNFTQLRISFHRTNYTSKHWAWQFLIILYVSNKRCPCGTPNNHGSDSKRPPRLSNESSKWEIRNISDKSEYKNLRSGEFSKRRVIRIVWLWSWCFRESLNYGLTRRRRWSWLCSNTSSRRVCKRSPQGKSGRSKTTVQSGRHFRRKLENFYYKITWRCQYYNGRVSGFLSAYI